MQINRQNFQMHNISLGSKDLVSEAFKNHKQELKHRAWKPLSRAIFGKKIASIYLCPRNYSTRPFFGEIIRAFSQQICISCSTARVYPYFQFVVSYCVGLFKYVFQSEHFRLLRRYG